ncbi:YgaP family membrane protein [Campylobacter canadensis]|uniref:YgaP family membrane protein n=1 Tax=Campylobacter canadensis TaxID=449520 RepID=UPI001CCB86B3|nr:DUF2892 domain-containing protein [Campylobacter canadensis]
MKRSLRIIIALLIFAAGIYYSSFFALIGLILLLTRIFKVCPIRVLTGKQACPLGVCPISKKKN